MAGYDRGILIGVIWQYEILKEGILFKERGLAKCGQVIGDIFTGKISDYNTIARNLLTGTCHLKVNGFLII